MTLNAIAIVLCTVAGLYGQQEVLIEEVVSREVTASFGTVQDPLVKEVVSKEVTASFTGTVDPALREVVSREVTTVITSDAPPPPVTQLVVDVSPTGETVVLDWSGYPEQAYHDIERYDVYLATAPFSDVTGMSPYLSVGSGGSQSVVIEGLEAYRDYYYAVVPVDIVGDGQFVPEINYAAGYVISPEVVSREVTASFSGDPDPPVRELVSREVTTVIESDAVPVPLADFGVVVSPTGESATLDWTSYVELRERDIVRYDIYVAQAPIRDLSGLVPALTVAPGTQTVTIDGLAAWTDHYFAIIPVDVGGRSEVEAFVYGAAYVLSPEVVSREVTAGFDFEPEPVFAEVISREVTTVIPDDTVPDPVTGVDSGFEVATSVSAFSAVDLVWPNYNELLQRDVARYRIYIGDQFFSDVSDMEPFAVVGAGVSGATVEGLDSGGIYHVAVVAEDLLGNFDPAVRSETGQASVGGVDEVRNLAVEATGDSLRFTWDPPGEGSTFLDSYRVTFSGEAPRDLSGAVREWEVFGLERGRSYPFRIATVDIFDNESGGRSLLAVTWLENPAGVVADGLDGRVELSWEAVEPGSLLEQYVIYQNAAEITDVTGLVPVATTTGTTAVVGGLANGVAQHFAVVAVNTSGGYDPVVVSVAATPVEDLEGPRVLATVPGGVATGELASLEIEFSEKVRASTVGVDDVLLGGVEGAFPAYAVVRVDDTHYRVDFGTKVLEGDYVVRLGPEVEDMEGNAMDQDGDGSNGEAYVDAGDPGDAFVGVVTLSNGAGPLVDGFSPAGLVNVAVAEVVVRFSDPVDPATVAGEIAVETGDGTPVVVTGEVVSADGREVTVSFAEQGADGLYRVRVGAGVRDVFGDAVQNWQLGYASDFEGGVGSEWSVGLSGTTPGGVRVATGFSGLHGAGTVTLGEVLPAEAVDLRVGFDLYVVGDWDGDGWSVAVDGAPLWETSFSTVEGVSQAYPEEVGGAEWPANSGAVEVDGLGTGTDAVYRLRGERELEVAHAGGDVAVGFVSGQDGDVGVQSWGLDEVRLRWRAQADPADEVVGTFLIDRTAPAVESMSLAGLTVSGVVDGFELVFDELVRNGTVAGGVTVTGPGGVDVPVSGATVSGERSYDVAFAAVTAPGFYEVAVAGVSDLAGNENVAYAATFTVEQADLRVTSVAGPAEPGYLGRPFMVNWTVQNVGAAEYDGSWRDRVWLVDGTGTRVRDLGALDFNGVLGGGELSPRELEVVVPEVQGAGSYRLAVVREAASAFELPAGAEATSAGQVVLEAESFPVIGTFQLGGVEVVDDLAVTGSGVLVVSADDDDGIAGASFWYQAAGAGAATLIGEDVDPGDGLEVFWPVGSLGNGVVDLIVRVEDSRGSETELRRTVRVVLGVPAAPVIASPVDGTVTRDFLVAVAGTASAESFLLIDQNGVRVFEGLPARDGTFSVELPLAEGANVIVARSRNLAGESAETAPLTVTHLIDFPDLVVEVDGGGVLVEGETVDGVVRVPVPVAEGLSFTVVTSRPSRVSVEHVVAVPPGGTEGSFVLRAEDDVLLDPRLDFEVRASALGYDAGVAAVTLLDDDWPTLSMVVSVDTVSEGDGALAAFATVTRQPAGVLPLVVALGSSDEGAIVLPEQVTIPSSVSSVTVPLAAVDDDLADGPQVAELVAAAVLEDGTVVADAGPLTVTVLDDESPALRLVFTRPAVTEGRAVPLRVRREGGDASGALEVLLSSGAPDRLEVPASVTIPDGAREVVVNVSALPLEGEQGSELLTLVAAAEGFDPVQAAVTVSDQPEPDLVVFGVEGPTEVESDQYFVVRYTVENGGGADAPGSFFQRVYLSDDPVPGDDVLLSQYLFDAEQLGAGLFFTREETMRAPSEGGRYWLIVETDPTDVVDEISEANNVVVAPEPIEVLPAYTAVVEVANELFTANEVIPMSGTATRTGDGQPAANVLVALDVMRGETRRRIAAFTDGSGAFLTEWVPLPGEGGNYEVGAGHPGVGELVAQDAFSIVTVRAEVPEPAALLQGEAVVQEVVLTNPTELALTGLGVSAEGVPTGLVVTPSLGATVLGAGESVVVPVTMQAAADAETGVKAFDFRVTSAEGLEIDFPMSVRVEPLLPQLVVDPGELYSGVVRPPTADTPTRPAVVEFTLRNEGTAATGPLMMDLPDVGWIRSAVASPMAGLAPGEERVLSLVLSPGADVPLTEFRGTFVLEPAVGRSISVPFRFRVVSELTGDLEVEVVDEFFYFTAEAPKVEGATVVVRDAISRAEVGRVVTGADGVVRFDDLAEAYYEIDVSTPEHTGFRGTYLVEAGALTRQQVFVSRNLVEYTWTVEEIEIEDRYRVTVESVFETNVPAPLVTVTPAVIDVDDLVLLGQTKVVNLTVENHGLISAEQGEFQFGDHPFYEFEPLVSDVGVVPAKSSITIPVTVRRTGVFDEEGNILRLGDKGKGKVVVKSGEKAGGRARVPCSVAACFCWSYICGPIGVSKQTPVAVSGVRGNCPSGGGGGGGGYFGSGGGAGIVGISFSPPTICDCTLIPKFCLTGEFGFKLGPIGAAIKAAVTELLAKSPYPLKVFKSDVSFKIDGKMCLCCEDGSIGWEAEGNATATIEIEFGLGAGAGIPDLPWPETKWGAISVSGSVFGGAKAGIKGEIKATGKKKCDGTTEMCGSGSASGGVFLGAEIKGSVSATLKNTNVAYSGSINGELSLRGGISVTATICGDGPLKVKACANLSANAFIRGEVQAGTDETKRDYLNLGGSKAVLVCAEGAGKRAPAKKGGDKFDTVYSEPVEVEVPMEELVYSREEAMALLGVDESDEGSVCARVKLRLDQEAVMTRSAFRATLDLENKGGDAPLTGVGFEFDIRDESGAPATDRFGIRAVRVDGVGAIDGTGQVPGNRSALVQWEVIPNEDAAPFGPATYTIGGTIRYTQAGTEFAIPVTSPPMTVRPDAALYLKYFHQRDVFSDDPHTDATEPSVPYSLALMVENRGKGAARDLSIASARPEIVENEKGLFIDFQIIATEVSGEPLAPTLTASFGDLEPGETKIGRWLMTSSVQGLFTDYSATFEHLDGLGDERLSLIKQVEIHEMIQLIEALGDKADGLPDFLVNDLEDANDYPDTVHLSDGTTAPVLVQEAAVVTGELGAGNLSVVIDGVSGGGWTYVRVPDPGDGAFRLVGVERSDGLEIPVGRNAWVTDRTFVGLGRRPVYENILHLVDCGSTGSYTLTYEPAPDPDVTAPTSQVVALEPNSAFEIPVRWGGTDDQGVAYYDVYVSVAGGPWEVWFSQTRLTSAIYLGEVGTNYSFYSVATDYAGNREGDPSGPDTTTVVSVENAAPEVDAIDDQVVGEGEVFELTATASDPDGATAALRYALVSDVPGLVIDENSGSMRWVTGEGDGGRSFPVTVRVTDGGSPAGVGSEVFQLTVVEENVPPVVEPVDRQVVPAGGVMIVQVQAEDTDLPEQALSFELGVDAPEGMAIDAAGVLTWLPERALVGQDVVVEVVVEDDGLPSASTSIEFSVGVVEPPDVAPEFNRLPVVLWIEGRSYEMTVSASDADGDPVTLAADLGGLSGVPGFEAEAGSGFGTLSWETTGVGAAVYQIPVTATARGVETDGVVTVRVAPDEPYWSWAADEVVGVSDPALFGLLGDPDLDGRGNVFERALRVDPLVPDDAPVTATQEVAEASAVTSFDFLRLTGMDDLIEFYPVVSRDLGVDSLWEPLPEGEWSVRIEPNGDDDGDPSTERVVIEVFWFGTSETRNDEGRKFFKLDGRLK